MNLTATSPEMTVAVELGPRAYEVRVVTGQPAGFGPFVRASLDRTWAGQSCRTALVVTDVHLAELSLPSRYQSALSGIGIESSHAVVSPGEQSKSLDRASTLYDN